MDTVNTLPLPRSPRAAAVPVYLPWQPLPHSCISHHGAGCCDAAKAWFLGMDYSLLNGASPLTGPRWIRQRYDWGPSAHPIFWCDAVKRKTLDCGALAALAHEAFQARGVESYPAQLVQQYLPQSTEHWAHAWNDKEISPEWISGDVIYHEGCAVRLPDNSLKIWDASAAWWLNPDQTEGYGSLAAVRIRMPETFAGKLYQYGSRRLEPNRWEVLAGSAAIG